MKTTLQMFVLLMLPVFLGCKDKPQLQETKSEVTNQQPQTAVKTTPIVSELLNFMDTTLVEGIAASEIFVFKKLEANGTISSTEMNEGIRLYNAMKSRNMVDAYPIFEIRDTDTVILPVEGVGFGGAIWAKVLVDRGTLEIKKIEFEHKAESDGYGAAITQSSFEDKFIGKKINLEKNTFFLQRNIEKRVDDGTVIDGISGATMTSDAVVEMVNNGLKRYKGYLTPPKQSEP